jgi:hypothetical protein
MRTLKNALVAGAFTMMAFAATQANALVYSPYDSAGSTEQVALVTPGYIKSWWVEDGTTGVSPSTGESPAKIRAFVEQPSILNTPVTDSGCREGLGGLTGTNKKCSGNVFAVKVNDLGYLVFLYATGLDLKAFNIQMNLPRTNQLSRLDVFTTAPSPVPVPAALPLLATGIAGMATLVRRRKKAAK